MNDDSPNTIPWPPRRASAQTECAADEGGEFRAPAPAKVQFNRPLFKSDEEMRAEGWEPASNAEERGVGLGTFIGAIVLVLGCWMVVQFAISIVKAAP